MQAFIDDGYMRTVGFNEVPKLRPKLEFTYRPYAGFERQKLQSKMLREEDGADQDFLKDIAGRLKSWNLEPEISYENLTRLSAPLCEAISNTFLGYVAPDYEIEATGEKIDTPPADPDQQGEDAKN